jgi:hypothetical protein
MPKNCDWIKNFGATIKLPWLYKPMASAKVFDVSTGEDQGRLKPYAMMPPR